MDGNGEINGGSEPQDDFSGFHHPVEQFLHGESLPSMWCSGCGIGTVANVLIQALRKNDVDLEKICLISSGIGCTGKIAEYLNIGSNIENEKNLIAHAVELSAKNPELDVVVILNDTDLIAGGADDFIDAGKDVEKMMVIYVNSLIYSVFCQHKELPGTPFTKAPLPDSTVSPFNMPYFAEKCGAVYVARWTPLHVRRLMQSMEVGLSSKGFSFLEIVSPCLMYYMSAENTGKILDRMEFFLENSTIKHSEALEDLDIRKQPEITVGVFIGREME